MSDFDTIRRKAWDEWWREAWWEQPRLITAFNAGYKAAVGRVEAELARLRSEAEIMDENFATQAQVHYEQAAVVQQLRDALERIARERRTYETCPEWATAIFDLADAALAAAVPPQDREGRLGHTATSSDGVVFDAQAAASPPGAVLVPDEPSALAGGAGDPE